MIRLLIPMEGLTRAMFLKATITGLIICQTHFMVLDAAGHWWEITLSRTQFPKHGTEAYMCSYPNGPIIRACGPKFPMGSI